MMKKLRFWMTIGLAAMLFLTSLPFMALPVAATTTDAIEKVPRNKEWIITFNEEVSVDYLREEYLYVADEKGQHVPIHIYQLEDARKVKVIPVNGMYEADTTYTLYVSDQMKNTKGALLNQKIEKVFQTTEEIEERKPFIVREDSANDFVVQDGVEYVPDELTPYFIEQDYEGNTYQFDVESNLHDILAVGKIYIFPTTESYPTGWAKRIVDIRVVGSTILVKTEEPVLEEVIESIDFSKELTLDLNDVTLDYNNFENLQTRTIQENKVTFEGKHPTTGIEGKLELVYESDEIRITFVDVVLKTERKKNNQTKDLSLSINGTTKLSEFRWKQDISGVTLNDLRVKFDMEADISINGNYSAKQRMEFFPSIPIPLGAYGKVNVQPFFLLDFEVEGSVAWSVSPQTVEAGITFVDGAYESFLHRDAAGASKGIQNTINYSFEGGMGIGTHFKIFQFLLVDVEVSGKAGQSMRAEIEKKCTFFETYGAFDFEVKGSLRWLESNAASFAKRFRYPIGEKAECEKAECENPTLGKVTSLMMKEQPVVLLPGQKKQLKLYERYESGEVREVDLSKGNAIFRPDQPHLLSISRVGELKLADEAYRNQKLFFEVVYQGISERFYVEVEEKKHEGAILPGQIVKLLLETERGAYFRVKSLGEERALVSYNTRQLGGNQIRGFGMMYKTQPGSIKVALGIDYLYTNIYMIFKNEGSSPIELEYDPSEMNVYEAPVHEMLYRERLLQPNDSVFVNNYSVTPGLLRDEIHLYNSSSVHGEILFENGREVRRKKVYPNNRKDRIAMIPRSEGMLKNIGVQPIRVVVDYKNFKFEPYYDRRNSK